MTFVQSVRSVFSQYATFSGRARRSEYWWFALAYILASIAAGAVDLAAGTSDRFAGYGLVGLPLTLVLFLPTIAVAARRLHDTGRSGWWQLIAVIPLVGWILMIVWTCRDSEGNNEYGPSPKNVTVPAAYPLG